MNDEERREYIKNVGKGGIKLLVIIEKLKPIVDLWLNHEIGKEYLDFEIRQHAELMNRVYDSIMATGEANREDLLSLKITYARLKKIGTMISNYDALVEKGKKREAAAVLTVKKRHGRIAKKV